jgi:hypothetical protein
VARLLGLTITRPCEKVSAHQPPNNQIVAPTPGLTWILLTATQGITAAAGTPTYNANVWKITPMGPEQTQWDLGSV